MTLLEKFEEKVLKENETGSFNIMDSGWCFHFIQDFVGKARYVYGEYGWEDENFYSCLDQCYHLAAIVAGETIYVVNAHFFNTYSNADNKAIPETIKFLTDFRKEMNAEVVNSVFPKFYEDLSTEGVDEDSVYTDCRLEARRYILSGGSVEGQIKDCYFSSLSNLLTIRDVADILCGFKDKYEVALQKLEREKSWVVTKFIVERILKYAKDPKTVAEWELRMSRAINGVEAMTINVEFKLNGKKAVGKMIPDDVLRKLKNEEDFCVYNFVIHRQGVEVLTKLGVTGYMKSEDKLTCKNITKITYGRKELYVKGVN